MPEISGREHRCRDMTAPCPDTTVVIGGLITSTALTLQIAKLRRLGELPRDGGHGRSRRLTGDQARGGHYDQQQHEGCSSAGLAPK
jgi:hypothetical protein